MKLLDLCRELDMELVCGKDFNPQDFEIADISVDSRKSCERSIFAPILGHSRNGADFVEDAYERGCRVFLSETCKTAKADCSVIKTNSARKSLAEISNKLYDYPASKIKIIGITGTKGKTTIALTLAKILEILGTRTFSIGTVGLCDGHGNVLEKTANTTPEPTELFRLISVCRDMGAMVIALEVSSQALMDFRIHGIEFFAVVFSSLGVDHIGKLEHASFTEYIRAKRSLFTDYKSKYRILSADDAYTPYIAFGTEKCIKCGFSEFANYRISDFDFSSEGSSFFLNGTKIVSNMPARYDAVNTSISIVLASLILKKNISDIAYSIPSVSLKGRFERHLINKRTVIIDYAHNKLSFLSLISAVRKIYKGRIILVFGSVGERSYGRRRELAEVAESLADFSIITSDNPGFESAIGICEQIRGYFKDKSLCEICVDREAAIIRAYTLSLPGDVILLLGKGHEEEMNISGIKIPFSEHKILEKLKKLK